MCHGRDGRYVADPHFNKTSRTFQFHVANVNYSQEINPLWPSDDMWLEEQPIMAQWRHVVYKNLVTTGSGNDLTTPFRRQVITWTNNELLSIGPFGANFSETWIEMHWFSFIEIIWKSIVVCNASAIYHASILHSLFNFIQKNFACQSIIHQLKSSPIKYKHRHCRGPTTHTYNLNQALNPALK